MKNLRICNAVQNFEQNEQKTIAKCVFTLNVRFAALIRKKLPSDKRFSIVAFIYLSKTILTIVLNKILELFVYSQIANMNKQNTCYTNAYCLLYTNMEYSQNKNLQVKIV